MHLSKDCKKALLWNVSSLALIYHWDRRWLTGLVIFLFLRVLALYCHASICELPIHDADFWWTLIISCDLATDKIIAEGGSTGAELGERKEKLLAIKASGCRGAWSLPCARMHRGVPSLHSQSFTEWKHTDLLTKFSIWPVWCLVSFIRFDLFIVPICEYQPLSGRFIFINITALHLSFCVHVKPTLLKITELQRKPHMHGGIEDSGKD